MAANADSRGGAPAEAAHSSGSPALLVLVHGLGRSPASLWPLARDARRHGFLVRNWGYPSRRRLIAGHAAAMHDELGAALGAHPGPVHFATHSLGGLVVRAYLAMHPLPNLGRVVMLAPPNGGTEVADALRGLAAYRVATGRPGQELGTEPDSGANRLPPATFEVGIIAGAAGRNPAFARWLPPPHDGTVPVARTRLAGMRDFIVLPAGHTFMMWDRAVRRQLFAFLEQGRFRHDDPRAIPALR